MRFLQEQKTAVAVPQGLKSPNISKRCVILRKNVTKFTELSQNYNDADPRAMGSTSART